MSGARPGQTFNLSGGAFIGSSDGSIDVEGGPAQGQIDLKLGGPSSALSLAAIYAFGLSDVPTLDNKFQMPTGERRWADGTALTTGLAIVSDAFFETPNTAGDSRIGAWITRRWRGGARPSTTFRTDIDYDPGYVGSPLDGTEWVIEQQYLSNSLDETRVIGDIYSQRKIYLWNFFDGQPESFPAPGNLTGTFARDTLEQWHGGPDAGVSVTRRMTGWGQHFVFTRPQRAGITGSHIGIYNNNTTADAVGNGAGYWIEAGSDVSHGPRGFYEAHMGAGGTLGAWTLGLWSYDGATMQRAATFNNTIATTTGPAFLGGPLTDPFAGFGMGGMYSNANATRYATFANQSGGAGASSFVALLCGSYDGSVGPALYWGLNSAAAAGGASLLTGPQNGSLSHYPTVVANLDIVNTRGDIRIGGGATGGVIFEVLRVDNTAHLLRFIQGLTAPGAVAVAITNAPAGVAATPVEYLKVEGTGGAVRYIPLLG